MVTEYQILRRTLVSGLMTGLIRLRGPRQDGRSARPVAGPAAPALPPAS
jgi:hypothetical protein